MRRVDWELGVDYSSIRGAGEIPALLPRPARECGLSCIWSRDDVHRLLDEFGHIGPYIARDDPRHNDSPVFGLAGFIMPLEVVRGFGTWFYQRKCDLLDFEIQRSGEHPAVWEKKGSSLYTVRNVTQYPELRQTTFRLLNKIQNLGGRVFYFGIRKTADPGNHEANVMYVSVPGGGDPAARPFLSRRPCFG